MSVADAPRSDEILVVMAIADGGRLRNRCGTEPYPMIAKPLGFFLTRKRQRSPQGNALPAMLSMPSRPDDFRGHGVLPLTSDGRRRFKGGKPTAAVAGRLHSMRRLIDGAARMALRTSVPRSDSTI